MKVDSAAMVYINRTRSAEGCMQIKESTRSVGLSGVDRRGGPFDIFVSTALFQGLVQ